MKITPEKIIGFILVMSTLSGLVCCTKQEDYSYLNTDRRPNAKNDYIYVGEKYKMNWEYITTDTLARGNDLIESEWQKILAVKKVDTLGKDNCPPLGTAFGIPFQYEIRRYIY